jgi:hypothetical protein
MNAAPVTADTFPTHLTIPVKQQQISLGSNGQDSDGRKVKHTQSTIFVTVATGDYVLGRDLLCSVAGLALNAGVGSAESKRVG